MTKTTDKEYKVTRKKGMVRIILSGELKVERIGELKEVMEKAIAKAKTVEVVVEDCDSADPSFLQLMCSVHKTAHSLGKQVEVSGRIPDFLVTLITCLGYKKNICSISGDVGRCLLLQT